MEHQQDRTDGDWRSTANCRITEISVNLYILEVGLHHRLKQNSKRLKRILIFYFGDDLGLSFQDV